MNYFITDVKSFLKSTSFRIFLLAGTIVMILDPIIMYVIHSSSSSYFSELGTNFYRSWLLMEYSMGNKLFFSLLYAFPSILTGLVYFLEQKSSVRDLLVTRGTWKTYFMSKVCSQFAVVFLALFFLFVLNGVVTALFFPIDGPLLLDYMDISPIKESFAYPLFVKSPLLVAFAYWILDALGLALLSLNALALTAILRFKNVYLALLVPFVVYTVASSQIAPRVDMKYDFLVMLQPSATWGVTTLATSWFDWVVLFGMILLADIVLLTIGYQRGRQSI